MIRSFLTEPDERVLCEYRRHWINVASPLLSSALLVVAALAGFYILGRFRGQLPAVIPGSAMVMGLLILVALAFAIAVLALWIYNQNRIYLTNYHVLMVTQNGLFSRKVSQLSLAKIQDVSVIKKGPIAMMLGYGTLDVETAGEVENFEFYQVADPYGLARQIMQAHEALHRRADGVSDTGIDQVA